MTAHAAIENVSSLPKPDRSFARVAQESFPNTEKPASKYGYLSSHMYDQDQPAHQYVGGATKWKNHLASENGTYGFLHSNREVALTRAEDMVSLILADSESDAPIHFNAIASGTEFKNQDVHVMRQIARQAGDSFRTCNIDEVNPEFGELPKNLFGAEFPDIRFSYTERDIFNDHLTSSVKLERPRRTIGFYSGGTIGNMGLTLSELDKGFPIKKMADHIKLQFDFGADEAYLIISHNAQTDASALENYQGKAHAAFALTAMDRIKLEIATRNFDPDTFIYKNYYQKDMDLVCHGAFSKTTQAFSLGNKEVHLHANQEGARVGHSFMISNARMGEIQTAATVERLGFYPSEDGKSIYQVIKASKKLMSEQRKKYGIITL